MLFGTSKRLSKQPPIMNVTFRDKNINLQQGTSISAVSSNQT